MAERIYPRMAYHSKWPEVGGRVVLNVVEDAKLDEGWDDTYGVRSVPIPEVKPETPEVKRGPGRPKVKV
jgi:hypothetical protein